MIRAAFSKMMDYPFLITFNGDDFDLRYLVHRAERLGIKDEEIPINLMRQEASLKHGVHIDLYRFFNNRSIQVYVYSNRYSRAHPQRDIGGGPEQVEDRVRGERRRPSPARARELLPQRLPAHLRAHEPQLLAHDEDTPRHLADREDADERRGQAGRLQLDQEHALLRAQEDGRDHPAAGRAPQKGGASSEAIIKGKKYKGGLVIEPKPGVHFGVSVLDFASLYPSIIKVHNLSYETVNCPHEECRSNKVPDTDHWVCRKRSGIESLVIGSLRDLRVGHYKHLAKDRSLSQEERELSGVVSQGLKVILNASYGVMGFETFALYCLPVAEATAAFGRDAITRTIEKCNQEGISVIYSDSVTSERCVTLLDPAGMVRVEPIGDFFSRFDEIWRRDDGKEEAHPNGWKALSFDQSCGKVEWKSLKAVIRHRTGKAIYRVRDKFGATRVTEDHSLVASGSSGPVLAKPSELSGKHLLRVPFLPEVRPIETIDLFEILRGVSYRVRYKGRWKIMEAHADENSVWSSLDEQKTPC